MTGLEIGFFTLAGMMLLVWLGLGIPLGPGVPAHYP